MNEEMIKELLEKLKQCDDFHKRCDFLMEHSEITYLLDYIINLQKENKRLYKTIEELSQYKYDREEEDMMNYIIEQEEVFNDYSFMEE